MKQIFDATDSCATNMQVRVFFGTPSNGCAGSGVCKMLPLHLTIHNQVPCPSFIAQCSFASDALSMLISREQFTEHQLHRWFASDYFIVEEDFWIPRWIVKQLDRERQVIPTGNHAFRLGNEAIELKLRLSEQETIVRYLNSAV